jgi:hypothetical protein
MTGPKGLLCPVDHVESAAAGADPAGVPRILVCPEILEGFHSVDVYSCIWFLVSTE